MRNFEVHSNDRACRKSGRLGLEQVLNPTRALLEIRATIAIPKTPRSDLGQPLTLVGYSSVLTKTI